MGRKLAAVLALLFGLSACLGVGTAYAPAFTEDEDVILLARVIYALGRDESYRTKLALGSVVMNRVDSPWFSDTLGGVLREQMQFPAGERYDDDSLSAAHAVVSGARTLSKNILYWQSADASQPYEERYLAARRGGYRFYTDDGRL